MGLNAFFAFTVVLTYKYTWQQALAAVFCSGVLFFLISVFRIRAIRHQRHPAKPEARDLGRRRAVPRHHRAGRGQDHRRASGDAGDARRPEEPGGDPDAARLRADRRAQLPPHHRRHADRHSGRSRVIGLPLGLAQFTGIVSMPPSLAPTLLQLDFSRVFELTFLIVVFSILIDRRVRQCRHADRRHPPHRADDRTASCRA